MKASNLIAKNLIQHVNTVFGITGGAVVNLFDSFDKFKFNIVTPNHEQAAAMMADGYARVTGGIGLTLVTSGPGATNLITGTACSYYDSIPVMNIAGQVPTTQLRKNNVRQYGFQEIDTVSLFKPITKYSAEINSTHTIQDVFNIGLHNLINDRPGPVFISICDDIQRAEVADSSFILNQDSQIICSNYLLHQIETALSKAQRPVLILGNGVKISKSTDAAISLARRWQIPVVLTWATLDMLDDMDELNMRDFGVTAQRAANFIIQESDLLICLGTRLDTHEAGTNFKTFAPNAEKIIVDLDVEELTKFNVDLPIRTDVSYVIDQLLNLNFNFKTWLQKTRMLRNQYPICPKENYNSISINPYVFLNLLSKAAHPESVITTDAGCTVVWTMQGWNVKKGQNLFTAYNNSPMGYSLPASIGAYYGNPTRPNICIIGDGGFQMNLQELALLAQTNIKVFVLDNSGYGMIRQTQDTWLNSRYVAVGGPFCDINDVATAYKIANYNLTKTTDLNKLTNILQADGPSITRILLNPSEIITPKLIFGNSIENSSPQLNENETLNIKKCLHG
jgi:acetolactate synthase I/II/III large subunit